jgi:cullin 3
LQVGVVESPCSIEAAIVRIMKTRKTLDHANLIAEVSKLLAPRFQASPQVRRQLVACGGEEEWG